MSNQPQTSGSRFRRVAAAGAAIAALALIAGLYPFTQARATHVSFNQHFIEDHWREHSAFTTGESFLARWSAWRAGLRNMFTSPNIDIDDVDFNDSDSILAFLFDNLPPVAIVYPTETYYYYSFPLRERRVSGNMRLLDAHEGKLHIGYFDKTDRYAMNARTFTEEDGVSITTLADNRFRVSYNDRTVTFVLPQRALEQPDSLKLLEYEEFITGVLDESSIAFAMLYNNITEGFYYVLNEDIPVSERLDPVTGTDGRFLVGERSRFVYYADPDHDRKLLVGVPAASIMANDPYDGPFDQVPPRLFIKDKLEAAYPYTLMRGGIDDHGNFIELDHQRVAISPYQAYDTVTELVRRLRIDEAEALVAADRWNRMTYETKRDFPSLGAVAASGEIDGLESQPLYITQGWPANHWGHNSYQWSESHRANTSSMWPPNHEAALSSGESSAAAIESES